MDSTISHTSPCVSVKSTITIYIYFLVCVSSVRGKKTDYEKKKGGSTFEGIYKYVCVCVCVCAGMSVNVYNVAIYAYKYDIVIIVILCPFEFNV